MAKRKPSKSGQAETSEVVEIDLSTVFKDGDRVEFPDGSVLERTVFEEYPLPPDSEYCYLFNEDTGETRQVVTRAGYAPAPMPFGFRLARAEEITDR